MIVIKNETTKQKTYSDLKLGDLFLYKNYILLKILPLRPIAHEFVKINSIDILNGDSLWMNDYDPVTLVDATITITDHKEAQANEDEFHK